MSIDVIVLPGHSEMFDRMVRIPDDLRLQERTYPVLLNHAGQEFTVPGLAMVFVLATTNYILRFPDVAVEKLSDKFSDIIDALVKNQELAKRVKDLFKSTL